MSFVKVTIECLVDASKENELRELGIDAEEETEFRSGVINSLHIISFYEASKQSNYSTLIETVNTTYGVKETIDDIRSQL